jgi:hypothetical protein
MCQAETRGGADSRQGRATFCAMPHLIVLLSRAEEKCDEVP